MRKVALLNEEEEEEEEEKQGNDTKLAESYYADPPCSSLPIPAPSSPKQDSVFIQPAAKEASVLERIEGGKNTSPSFPAATLTAQGEVATFGSWHAGGLCFFLGGSFSLHSLPLPPLSLPLVSS